MIKASERAVLPLLATLLILGGCVSTGTLSPQISGMLERDGFPPYPAVSFAVLSDPHLYAPSLGVTGEAFENHVAENNKLLRESTEILESAIRGLEDHRPDFLIISGDLTKDGEKISHVLLSEHLADLESRGIEVYVVPGNHDVLNKAAVRYVGAGTEPVEAVSTDEFRQIYRNHGYSQAVARDRSSLSYVVEPVAGLWILALDSARYRDNNIYTHTDGKLYRPTLKWLRGILDRSVEEGKAVFAFLHHGLVEHYQGQQRYFEKYLVDGYESVSRWLADYGVRMVFTGHYHSQDITVKRWQGKRDTFLYDIETGSLLTYPNPYRIVRISEDQIASIASYSVDAIQSRPNGFSDYSRRFLLARIETIAMNTLAGYSVSEKDGRLIAPQAAAAFVAHHRGDESPPSETVTMSGLSWWGRFVMAGFRDLITGVWHDLEPPDNILHIDLNTGEWRNPEG
jgi:3',5'-cyclic AMP phosphodiesterase CpdA